jgi:gamma-glutamylcyclotransferase (GGCT)/AIG2-like uncharacterized protein YtfP
MNIFTYGSLMFPQVWEKVVRRQYHSAQAELAGHARYAVAGETYPGMVPMPGQTVRGVVYFDVAASDIAALDAFEGSAYKREDVQARLDSGETVAVATYIYLDTTHLTNTPWLPEAFQMQRFLETYCRDKLA